MTSQQYSFGYELQSKQVRAYQPHDLGSVKRAITANLQEYLVFEGVTEEDPTSLKNLFLKVVTISCAAGIYFMSKSGVSAVLVLGSIAAFTALIGFQYACSVLQQNEDVVFVGTGKVLDDPLRQQKPTFQKLKNQRLCVRLKQEDPSTPVLSFEMQLIGQSKLFSPPSVYWRTERTVQYGQFFSPSGFFFPPPLTKLADDMLEAVLARKQK